MNRFDITELRRMISYDPENHGRALIAEQQETECEEPQSCPECGERNCDPDGIGHYRG